MSGEAIGVMLVVIGQDHAGEQGGEGRQAAGEEVPPSAGQENGLEERRQGDAGRPYHTRYAYE